MFGEFSLWIQKLSPTSLQYFYPKIVMAYLRNILRDESQTVGNNPLHSSDVKPNQQANFNIEPLFTANCSSPINFIVFLSSVVIISIFVTVLVEELGILLHKGNALSPYGLLTNIFNSYLKNI